MFEHAHLFAKGKCAGPENQGNGFGNRAISGLAGDKIGV